MNAVKRYWAVGLILLMVVVHAILIGYVRSRVARLTTVKSSAIEIGAFRFQPVTDPNIVYQFQLHAIVEPLKRNYSEERLTQMRMEIREASEQLLRQVDPAWLEDPAQTHLRDRLMDVVLTHLGEPLIQRVLITDWLKIPVSTLGQEVAEPKTDLASR